MVPNIFLYNFLFSSFFIIFYFLIFDIVEILLEPPGKFIDFSGLIKLMSLNSLLFPRWLGIWWYFSYILNFKRSFIYLWSIRALNFENLWVLLSWTTIDLFFVWKYRVWALGVKFLGDLFCEAMSPKWFSSRFPRGRYRSGLRTFLFMLDCVSFT